MRLTKRQLKRIIRESILLKESKEEALAGLQRWGGDWEYSEQECLDWWMNEGEHLVEYLLEIDPMQLREGEGRLLEYLLLEFGLISSLDGYGY